MRAFLGTVRAATSLLRLAAVMAAGGVVVTPGGPCAGQPNATDGHHEVEASRGILYYKVVGDPDPYRHQLDVYRPKGKGPFPVLVFLHGGGWVIGSKDDYFGLYGYGTIARRLAGHGLVVVLPNYRLSPAVRHPEHVKDVARAFAWTCRNARKYGGDPRQIFVGGHSAGGHLAALLATDDRYLKEVGRARKDVRGVIGVSGVYRLDKLDFKLVLAGPGGAKVLRARVRPLAVVFGDDPEVARQASPLTHVRPGLPPFLLVSAGLDYLPLRQGAREFAAALEESGCEVQTRTVPWRTHETLVFDLFRGSADPVTTGLIADFIRRHAPEPAPRRPRR
jgi:acetyl esterase/lipase